MNTTCLGLAAGAPAQDATLANPVGLYFEQLQPGSLTGPSDEPLDDWFKFVRGSAGRGLMAVLEPPAGASFGLESVKVKGVKLEWGGQVAECIDMVLYAKVIAHKAAVPGAIDCAGHCCMPAGTTAPQIKNVNLDQQSSGTACRNAMVDAYPELVGAPRPFSEVEAPSKEAALPRKLRTRLAAE